MPHWTLRALTTFSLNPLRNSDVFRAGNDSKSKLPSVDAQTFPSTNITRPELEDGLATPPDLDDGDKTSQTWLCKCEYREIDFCPYCEYDQTVLVKTSIIRTTTRLPELDYPTTTTSIAVEVDTSNDRPPPRKLRKIRSNYHQLHYEAFGTADIGPAKPDSIISANSRTPLLNTHIRSNPDYLPLPPERRPRNKLEKRGKRLRSMSFSDGYSMSISTAPTKVSHSTTIASKSFLRPKTKETLGPRPKPMSSSIDTDTLVSLAWTGEVLSPIRSSELLLSGQLCSTTLSFHESPPHSITNAEPQPETISKKKSSIGQPPLTNKRSVLQKPRELDDHRMQSLNRPWTLAMAITDDGITDEKLVNDLEEMRIKEVQAGPVDLGLELHPFYRSQLFDSYAEYPLQAGETEQEDIFSADSSWTAARQALLLCRELVRTERRYLASLKTLITNGTSTPPPPSMLPYFPGLIMASKALLERMEVNPSAQGVSDAFITCEGIMKEAFIQWCGIVGQFFDSGEKPKSRTETEDSTSPSSSGNLKYQRSQPNMTRGDSGLSVVIPEPNKIRKNTKSRPTVRDLAILPTQRIMRYVLLFKELYSLTPSTLSSFEIVEKAFQAAETIAKMANNAQGHIAFEQPS